MHKFLSLYLFLLALATSATAQSTRLSVQQNEIRVVGGNFTVEKHSVIVLPAANYTITETGRYFMLPQTANQHTIQLPPAASFPLREISIINKSATTGNWIVTGGFVTRETYGQPPFNPQNNVLLSKGEKLVLISDGEKWWDVNNSGAEPATPPKVDAGEDRQLPSSTSSVNLVANVTIGNTPIYETVWRMTRQPNGSTPILSDTTANSLTVTNMAPGNYTFRVTITDDIGLRAIDSVRIYIQSPARMFYSGGYANNVYDSETGQRTWISLPDGYNPDDTTRYPLVLFFHGMGENGTDPEIMLAPSGGLPFLLYDKAFNMKSIVVMPQIASGFWQAEQARKAFEWARAGYKVDPDRVYATGLSSGAGGTCDVVYGNPTLFAAYAVCATPDNNLRLTGSSVKNIPSMYLQGYVDPYVYVSSTADIIESINAASPKGIYPPIVRTVWGGTHDERLWNVYFYDKRVAPLDFETDYFLLYSRNRAVTATNFVSRAEVRKDYTDYAIAKDLVDKLTAGADKTALLGRLSALLTTLTNNVNYYVIDPGVSSFAQVPNTNKITSAMAGTLKSNLVDIKGVTSTKSVTMLGGYGTMKDSCPQNNYLGFDQSVYRDGLMVTDTGAAMKISGLSGTAAYDVRIFYSNNSRNRIDQTGLLVAANNRSGNTTDDGFNTTQYLDLFNVKPDANGEIIIQLDPQFNFFGIVNVIMLKEKLTPPQELISRYDFGLSEGNVPGWINVTGDPVTEPLEFYDANTGWILSTRDPLNWRRYFTFYASDNDGAQTGNFGPEFPAGVVKSYFSSFDLKFDGSNFNLELKKPDGQGLDQGTYQIKMMASVSSSAMLTASEQEFYVKFGNGATQKQTIAPTNNTDQFRTFTGKVLQGETIKLSVNRSSLNFGDVGFINGLIVEKVD